MSSSKSWSLSCRGLRTFFWVWFELNIIQSKLKKELPNFLRLPAPPTFTEKKKSALPTLPCPAHQYPSALVSAPACLWKKLQRLFSGATQRGAECGINSVATQDDTLARVAFVAAVWRLERREAAGLVDSCQGGGAARSTADEPLGSRD